MTDFAETLRTWRKARRLSQLDLAGEANVSSRHISFLETGRASPSREMVGRLSDALALPLASRNQMLTDAGFAARYPGRSWDAQEMAPIRAALSHTLKGHDPYPAFAVDRLWTVLRMNQSARALFGLLGIAEGVSLLDLMASGALRPLIENWAEVAQLSARRLRMESVAQGGVDALDHVAGLLELEPPPARTTPGPVVPAIYRAGPVRLSLISTIAQFGTPEDLTLDDLRIEMFFPADPATEAALRDLSWVPGPGAAAGTNPAA